TPADRPPAPPARPPGLPAGRRVPAPPRLGPLVVGATAVEAAFLAFLIFTPSRYTDNEAMFLPFWAVNITYVVILVVTGLEAGSRRRERSHAQLPPSPAIIR